MVILMAFQLEDCIFFQLAKASQLGTRFWASRVSEYNITPSQAMVVNFLGHEDRITARDLALRTALDRATLTGVIDRLETAGYLKRMPHPEDRRAQLIALTEQGKELAGKIFARVIEANREFLKTLDEGEQEMLKKLLARLRQNAAAETLPQNEENREEK